VTDAIRLDQLLARKAAQLLDGKVDPELRTRMRSLPVMIQTNGLAATVAFLLSRRKAKDGKDAYHRAARLILDDAVEAAGITVKSRDPERMLADLAEATPAKYMLAETRAQLLAIWLARLAQALAERQKQQKQQMQPAPPAEPRPSPGAA